MSMALIKIFQGDDILEKEYKTTAATRMAAKKYLSKFHDIKIRLTPEEHEALKNHAQKMGLSVSTFIKRAVSEAIDRDNSKI